MSRMQADYLTTFTGGLNLRRSEFQLAETESPAMLNVEVDPRGGFYSRRGWQRWNATDIVADPATNWHPRSAEIHLLSTGSYQTYVANGSTIYAAAPDAMFSDLAIPCAAEPHLADFTAWGDAMYIATGRSSPSQKRDGTTAPVAFPAVVAYNNDYTIPIGGQMPQAEHVTAHAGYLFVADLGAEGRNRIRWSHPDEPEDWAERDRIDIKPGGGRITGLMSFRDHLLIFKTDSVWALYGYGFDSWQLINVSSTVGCPSPAAAARSETAAYFFSNTSANGIYAYAGESPVLISEQLKPAMEEIQRYEDVWLGWVGRRLWCSVPWVGDDTADLSVGDDSTSFVFAPDTGEGAWTPHRAALGNICAVISGSDVYAEKPLAVLDGSSGAAALVRLDALSSASDAILESGELTGFRCVYRTGWRFSEWPTRRKSWLRPKFVTREPLEAVTLRTDVYWNYESGSARRSGTMLFEPDASTPFWRLLGFDDPAPNGWDWKVDGAASPDGRGMDWSAAGERSSKEARAVSSLGVADSIQLQISNDDDPGKEFRIDEITLPYNLRRFTT